MRPSPRGSTREYVIWLIRLGHLLTKRLNRSLVEHYDLTFQQVQILFVVYYSAKHNCPLTLRQLAERLQVSLPNVTTLIARLQSGGYLKKRVMRHDRRQHDLVLTPRGQKLWRTLKNNWPPPELQAIDHFFKTISAKKRTHFATVLMALTKYLYECDQKAK